MKRLGRSLLVLAVVVAIVGGGFLLWLKSSLGPGSKTGETLVRYEKQTSLSAVLADLQQRGVVRNPGALSLYARWKHENRRVAVGTYRFEGGEDGPAVLASLRKPVRQMVRIPETNWARRTGGILEMNRVCSREAYMELVHRPQDFQKLVPFSLPKDTLEGYLYPDTYDLPPLLGARAVILRQLRNFKKRVWDGLDHPKDLHRLLTVASMVQMEVAKPEEAAKVAGVIENRLAKGMRLQIDATVNYAIQKWRPLTLADLDKTDSPYNTYRNKGLPPGPICSPNLASIRAALQPDDHHYLYYVANPVTHYHLFASTFDAHRQNIAVRRKLLKAMGQ